MSRTKTKIFTVFLFLSVMTFGLIPGGLKAQGACCFEGKIGVDFLYWTPCISDMDYAIVADGRIGEDDTEEFKTKYIDLDWEAGVRVYGKVDDLWCGFNGAIIYTFYDADAKSSTDTENEDGLKTSISIPDTNDQNVLGEEASGKWELEYHTLDAILSYPLQLTCNSCLEVEAFSGLKWLCFCQERHDEIVETTENERIVTIKRELEFWGIGPTLGVKSSYTICDCIKTFGFFATSLMVGESENKDEFNIIAIPDEEETLVDQTYKNDDDCVCFPGMHLMTGISYETCLCDMEVAVRLGWEYVHWFNAPTFPFYERNRNGDRSATSDKNLTLQGVFAGLNISF